MRFLPPLAAVLLLGVPAKADRFWLSDPKDQQAAPGSSPNAIDGVLLAADDANYHVRVVGGELFLPKHLVFRIDRDDLTLEAIAAAEREAADRSRMADTERQLTQEIARRERDIRLAEASLQRSGVAARPAVVQIPAPIEPLFDPVIGVASPLAAAETEAALRDARIGWSLTRDRRYLKMIRQLRRAR